MTVTATRGGAGGWADLPGDTALSIRVPEANHLVSAGFPAHVTVLYPFLHASRLSASAHAELTEVFAGRAPFTLTFTEFRRYPGVLYLPPAPEAPVRALTAALTDRWPEAVPYRGIFTPPLAPHLTLANHEGPDTCEAAYDALESRLAPHLPLVSHVHEVHLIVTDGSGGWRDLRTYRLGEGAPERRPGIAHAKPV
ncbi:2'-5' RNA ligase family protein [Streptomyces sp. G44]|uniref:2'-5' RNA ligase family protein n=1 Tax=Streptomyces sp. G44 TaxID=2807632 RepID=UPI001960C675|nr:2'-5' RNA ligase family protein [Streptomyces sp. G44]MBM7171316.1 2'-5' RNA ligase family protein [Streptomyces sp. G44]